MRNKVINDLDVLFQEMEVFFQENEEVLGIELYTKENKVKSAIIAIKIFIYVYEHQITKEEYDKVKEGYKWLDLWYDDVVKEFKNLMRVFIGISI